MVRLSTNHYSVLQTLVMHIFISCDKFCNKFKTSTCIVVFEGFHGEERCERWLAVTLHVCILSWESDGGPEKGKYAWAISGPFLGPPLLSQERMHGVTANPLLASIFAMETFRSMSGPFLGPQLLSQERIQWCNHKPSLVSYLRHGNLNPSMHWVYS